MDGLRRALVGTALAAMLIVSVVMLLSVPASAAEDPIPGVDVIVERVPPGSSIGRFRSDGNGYLRFKSLDAGTYHVTDRAGSKAIVWHKGGPANWRLMGIKKNGKLVWTLADESDPALVEAENNY